MAIISIDSVSVDVLTTMVETGFDEARAGFRNMENSVWEVFTMQTNAAGREEILQTWMEEIGAMQQWTSEKQFQDMVERRYKTGHDPYSGNVRMRREDLLQRVNVAGMSAVAADIRDKLAFRAAQLDIGKVLAELTNPVKLGYDGKALFAADHPDGATQSNQDTGGGGNFWYLMALGGRGRPIIRQDGEVDGGGFQIKDHVGEDTSENFMKRLLYWSVEFWGGWHPGLWQTIYRSNQALTAAFLDAAIQAQSALVDFQGEQMGIVSSHILVGRSNHRTARALLNPTLVTTGGDNVDQGIVDLLFSPRLA